MSIDHLQFYHRRFSKVVFLPDATGASRCQCGSKINPLTGFSAFCDEALTVPYTSASGSDMTVVGADGCRAGWIAVRVRSGGAWDVDVYPNATMLWHNLANANLILIDIPIGLPDRVIKSRNCDRAARRILGGLRASSIFPPPSRASGPRPLRFELSHEI